MLPSKAFRKALVSLLLITVFAVLAQGVLHEVFHDSDHESLSTAAELISNTCHSEDCHAHHQYCSSLSCTHGDLFLAEAAFCWQTFGQIELLKFSDDRFQLPIISANFFKPPRSSIS